MRRALCGRQTVGYAGYMISFISEASYVERITKELIGDEGSWILRTIRTATGSV